LGKIWLRNGIWNPPLPFRTLNLPLQNQWGLQTGGWEPERQGAGSVQKGNGKTGSRIPMWPEAGEILETTPCIIFVVEKRQRGRSQQRCGGSWD